MSEDLKKLLYDAGKTEVESAQNYLSEKLGELQQNGDLGLGKDKNLTGFSLRGTAEKW